MCKEERWEGWGKVAVARDLSAAAQDGGFAGRRASGPNETQQKGWLWRLYGEAGGPIKGPKDDLDFASSDRLEEEWPWDRIWGQPAMSEQSGYVAMLSTVSGRSPDQIRHN